jgi:hypothetical protein
MYPVLQKIFRPFLKNNRNTKKRNLRDNVS